MASKTSTNTAVISFDRVKIFNSATRQLALPARYQCLNQPAPICIQNAGLFVDIVQIDDSNKLGGVQFHDVSVVDENHMRPAVSVVDSTGHGIAKQTIAGTVQILYFSTLEPNRLVQKRSAFCTLTL